ncbi:unnamed protein product [Paramecium pentaurelia]|uniref:Uncharacterized protein n=1 Tax=Paramecium pentaurelia TaxID=43138 RepID=A0A8S1W5X4_9CILI|nr:unnamed protein product [Paramecium pentaurelia]
MFQVKIIENEKDLQCAMKHELPVLMVNLNPNLQSNQRLLCEKCLYYFESDAKMIGFKKIIQMIEENKKKSFDNCENLIKLNINKVQSIESHIQQLKSKLNQSLNQILQEIKEWDANLQSLIEKSSDISFFQEINNIILNQQSHLKDQSNLSDQIKILNDNWNKKIITKLESLTSFNEFQLCKEILNGLSQQSIQEYN